ncbi:MAG TPA: hemerythrin domain-containing protein [Kofleriaceae bacterium]|jgi:hemerythrin-like domain-containing protein|nr:hemerythrin domain-containing protein [Casimicrobiaceae bacterium]HVK84800.1 hemerythrin domain-containing protein [Kofleriaceae bacterium]
MNALLPGADAATFDDPLAMLVACHGRIRKQLATLGRLERHLPGHGHDADARAAARAIMRYFDSAAVHHHEDEEASLLPRLLARAPDAQALASRLLAEHRELAGHWRKLRPLLSGIATGQRAVLPPRLVHEITHAYEAHIEIEEAELIPLAQDLLAPDEIAAIGREMAQRRGVS